MRRKSWILSMLGAAGLTFGQLHAEDPFAATPAKAQKSEPGTSLYFPASGTTGAADSKQPTRFQRSTDSQAKEPDAKNFYKELFGERPAAVPSADGAAATPASGGAPAFSLAPKPAEATAGGQPEAAQGVIAADHQVGEGQGADKQIQQVSGEARPFPGASPAPAAPAQAAPPQRAANSDLPVLDFSSTSAVVPTATPAPSTAVAPTPAAAPVAAPVSPANPFPQTRSTATPRSALTDPIPTSGAPGGTLSITRGTPSAPAPAPQPAVPAQTSSIVPVSHSELRGAAAASQGPVLSLTWSSKGTINVGQECICELRVRNSGTGIAEDVEVEAYFPNNVRLVDAVPRPDISESYLGWEFDEIDAGSEQVITVKMVPLQRGDINAEAQVRSSSRSARSFSVAEPLLNLGIEGPTEVMIGEAASQKILVSNPGNGIATNVKLLAAIPAGLKHAGGERIEMLIGSLNPGETRPVTLPLIAGEGGRHLIEVQARGDAGLVRAAATEVAVIAPSLKAGISGPGLRYVGRQAVYSIGVTNDGAAATDNVRVMYKIPQGLTFVSSDKGTQYDSTNRLLSWFVGRMERGQTAQLSVTLTADQIGEFSHLVRATSEYGMPSDAQLATVVEGTPSLSLVVSDLDDPVEVGSEAAYEVRVKNEGSAAAKMVALACELAPSMTYLRGTGPTRCAGTGANVQFEPIPELAPGDTATFTVVVSTKSPGSLKFRSRLSSESIPEPLTSDELTKFYGE